MAINSTDVDRRIELKVADYIRGHFDPLKHLTFEHNGNNETSTFDFDLTYLGHCQAKLDVRVVTCSPGEYDGNIVPIHKYEAYALESNLFSHWLVYYYPKYKYIRIYDMDRGYFVPRTIHIHHVRENQDRDDPVMIIKAFSAVAALNGVPDLMT